jgi:hypothetical protein
MFECQSVHQSYLDVCCEDAPVPPLRPIPMCEHDEEAHVKQ